MNLLISEEIMFEIFSWLPVKSLLRFKCITKFCKSHVSESHFVYIHTCRSMSRTKFILREKWESIVCTAELREDEKDFVPFLGISTYNFLYLHGLTYYPHLNCVNGLCCMWDPLSTGPAAIFKVQRKTLGIKAFSLLFRILSLVSALVELSISLLMVL